MGAWEIQQGNSLDLMALLSAASVDAVVTDPPYGLSFMGKKWDHGVPGVPFWAEALRVLKPGGHLVAFGGTRTYHRLTCAIEDAGFEVRDCLMWLYGSGFPKSLDVSKAIDKAAGAERAKVSGGRGPAYQRTIGNTRPWMSEADHKIDGPDPITAAAAALQGWGTALKPAWEPIILARKPLVGTVAANVQEHGTGALNVEGCRIGSSKCIPASPRRAKQGAAYGDLAKDPGTGTGWDAGVGRWPANLVLDEEAARLLDEQSGDRPGMPRTTNRKGASPKGYGIGIAPDDAEMSPGFGDSGGASRFFYTAKASSGERHYAGKNAHPTVKPVDLMRWLCRLVTPKGGLVLDPFMGSGSTGVAALSEGFRFLGMEIDPESVMTARRRIAGPLFAEVQP